MAARITLLLVVSLMAGCLMKDSTPHVLAIHRQGGALVSFSGDGMIREYDPASLRERARHPLAWGDGQIFAASFSPAGKYLVVADSANTVRVFEAGPRKFSRWLLAGEMVSGAAIDESGKYLAILTKGGWRIDAEGRDTMFIDGHGDHFSRSVAFAPDGRSLALGLGNLDGPRAPSIRVVANVLDSSSSRDIGPLGITTALAFSPDGKTLAYAAATGPALKDPSLVGVLSYPDGKVLAEIKDDRPYEGSRTIAFDGKEIICTPLGGRGMKAFTFADGKLTER